MCGRVARIVSNRVRIDDVVVKIGRRLVTMSGSAMMMSGSAVTMSEYPMLPRWRADARRRSADTCHRSRYAG